jgi:hypothetical protein
MALKETTADLASASAALSGPEQENAIRIIAAELKRRHPQASAEIVNHLLTAYCHCERESGLSDRESAEDGSVFHSVLRSCANRCIRKG